MTSTSNYTTSWRELENGLGVRPVLRGNAEELRAQFTGLGQMLASQMPPPSGAVLTEDHSISGLSVRIYMPRTSAQEVLPVGIFAHGGGYVLGSLDSEDTLCRALVENTGSIIVSVDYRLAPETKAPGQLDDMVEGLQWAYEHAASFNGDTKRFFTIGGSAGGSLSLMLARRVLLGLTAIPKDLIRGIVALSPVAFHPQGVPEQYISEYKAPQEVGSDSPMIDNTTMKQFLELTGVEAGDSDYFVGLDNSSLGGFPPTYVSTCENDPLRDDGRILVRSLKEAGVVVKDDHYPGLPHVFWLFPNLPETGLFMSNTFAAVQWLLQQM